jgi:long-chain fatty acid transport protein
MIGLSAGLCANGFNLNSNGAKSVSMGGAFVGLADDFSAVFWNPAGLIQMKETTLSFFVSDIIPSASYQLTYPGVFTIDTDAKAAHYFTGSIGFFKPLSEKVVVGIYAYVPSGTGIEWEGADLAPLTNGAAYNWKTYVGIISVSPAIAFKLSDQLSLGATLNINYGLSKLHKPGVGQYEEDLNAVALGATVGMLFKPSEKFSFGLTFRTPFKANLKGDAVMTGAPLLGLPGTDEATRQITFPMWAAAGIALKPTDKLTFTADVQYTNWKEMDVLPMEYTNPGWKLFFERPADLELFWKDTFQLRFGMEYKTSEKLALRAGYYYDPNPSPKRSQIILLPEHTYNWITFGLGYSSGSMTFDIGIEYGLGKDVEIGLTELGPDDPGMPGIQKLNLFVPTISLVFRF